MKIRNFIFLLLVVPSVLFASARAPRRPEVRAIWVTRFDYKTPQDVSLIVANCANVGFTDIFFQVRGNGTVFYPSRVEPWAFELTGKNPAMTGRNPGWNPLQTAAMSAKRHNIRLHAYLNVLPGWRGNVSPPAAANQLWTAHRDWFMVDSTGTTMKPASGWYSFLNPAHPRVRQHLSALVAELSQYDIAGIHLDYIRFPYDYKDVAPRVYRGASKEQIKAHSTFSFDPISLSVMDGSTSKKKWDLFRRESVTRVVRDLNRVIKERKGKQTIVSASVLADFSDGYSHAFQDSRRWTKERLVDWVVPMNYTASSFDRRLSNIRRSLGRDSTTKQLVVGIQCNGDIKEIRRQIKAVRAAGCRGIACFSYSYLFEGHRPTEKASLFQ